MERQIRKFNSLLYQEEQSQKGGCSKHQSGHSKVQGPGNKDKVLDKNKNENTDKNQERTKKWVINLSSVPLTKAQEDLLVHGPNFVVTPQKPPWGNT